MSYGCDICCRCGSEVKTYDSLGGTCPHCGAWVSAGTHDEIAEARKREEERERIHNERMKHIIKIVVECSEADDDRFYRWSKEFTNMEDADKWANSQSGCVRYHFYDEKGRID